MSVRIGGMITPLTIDVENWLELIEANGSRFLEALGRKVFDQAVVVKDDDQQESNEELVLGEGLAILTDRSGRKVGFYYKEPTPAQQIQYRQKVMKYSGKNVKLIPEVRRIRIAYAIMLGTGIRKGDLGYFDQTGKIVELTTSEDFHKVKELGYRLLEALGMYIMDLDVTDRDDDDIDDIDDIENGDIENDDIENEAEKNE
ncbi:MAG: hypothetical protein GY749_26590 [Desulfobacteraceae bacterium]|nr:hypothetical protein [Desulfobacteraceae bacterium]